jgi:hypothetical protein
MGIAGRRMVEALFDTQKNVTTLETLFLAPIPAETPPGSAAASSRAAVIARSR